MSWHRSGQDGVDEEREPTPLPVGQNTAAAASEWLLCNACSKFKMPFS